MWESATGAQTAANSVPLTAASKVAALGLEKDEKKGTDLAALMVSSTAVQWAALMASKRAAKWEISKDEWWAG